MKLHHRIQHVAGRDASLARLLERLPPAVEVMTDPDWGKPDQRPSPLRGYLRCLADPPKDVTHLVVLQDDALPCKRFHAMLTEAVGERPEDVISLFVGGLSNRTRKDFYAALGRGDRWSPIYFRDIHHVVALVWPVTLAKSFLQWYASARIPGPIPPRSDDAVVGYWARKQRRQIWATVPCLVEHPDDVPSTIHSLGRQGDKGRRAIHWQDA